MSGNDASKFSLKLSNSAKEHIKLAAQKTEQRLRDEQKSVCISFSVLSSCWLRLICFFLKFAILFVAVINSAGEKSKTSSQSPRAHEFRRREKED